jgi:hypothetical protein
MTYPRTREARVLLAAIAAALSIGLVATSVLPASAAAATKTKVKLKLFADNDGEIDQFYGVVNSPKARCRAPRQGQAAPKDPGP